MTSLSLSDFSSGDPKFPVDLDKLRRFLGFRTKRNATDFISKKFRIGSIVLRGVFSPTSKNQKWGKILTSTTDRC